MEGIDLLKQHDFSSSNIQDLQQKDAVLRPIIEYLKTGTLPKLQREARKLILKSSDYMISGDFLYHLRRSKSERSRSHKPNYQLVLPKSLIRSILELCHDSPMGGHGGIQATIDLISEYFYFDKLPSTVTEYVQSCHDCQTRKMTKAHTKSGIIAYKTPTEPFQVWQIDLFGPLPITNRGNTYIFTAIDMFSKLVFNVPIPNCDSMTVSCALFDMFCQFGVCSTIISDRGSEFISACTKHVSNLLGIQQNFTPSMIHHCLGACERTHRTLAERLTPFIQKNHQWDDILPAVTFSMNSTVNASTKYSPFEVVYGLRPRFPLCSLQMDFANVPVEFHDYIKTQAKKLDVIRESVKSNALKSGQLMSERYNQKLHSLQLSVGDYVYMLVDPIGQGRKFQPKYSGPFAVHTIVSPHLVQLRDLNTNKVMKNEVHLDRLKVAYVQTPDPHNYFLPELKTTCTENQLVQDQEDHLQKEPEVTAGTILSAPPVSPPPRRSARLRKRPIRFQGSSFDTDSSSEQDLETTESDIYYKIKRILATRTREGKPEYKIQFKGEPAQNAMWIPFEQLNQYARTLIQQKPPPCID